MGFLCAILSKPSEPGHCELWVGQTSKGMHNPPNHSCRGCDAFPKVFATSEPFGHETNIHRRTEALLILVLKFHHTVSVLLTATQVWELASCRIQTDHIGHTGYINTVTISPDGSLCASGGKDGTTMLWDLNESKHLYSLQAGDEIHALVFSPNRYWLCAATASSITIFDLEKKSKVDELKPEYVEKGKKSREPECVSLAWSADGQTLFSGYTDNKIRAWGVMSRA